MHQKPTPYAAAEQVREVVRITGEGVMRAKSMLERAQGDVYLAAGYCRATGLAVNVKGGPEARTASEDQLAARYAADFRARDRGVAAEDGPAP